MKFWVACMNIKAFVFRSALPGAHTWKGVRTYELRLDMACRDGRQYFITDIAGENCPANVNEENGLDVRK